MASANNATCDADLLDVFARGVMVGDAARETELHDAVLTLDDANNLDGCIEVRNEARTDVIDATAAISSTSASARSKRNTFGGNLVNLITKANANKVRELSFVDTAIAERVEGARGGEMGVQTSVR